MPELKHYYRIGKPFVRFAILTAGSIAALIFVLTVFQKLLSWEYSYQKHKQILSRPIPVAQEKKTALDNTPAKASDVKNTDSMGVFRAQDNAGKQWNWPDSLALNKKALHEFTRAKKWDSALHIGAQMNRDILFQDELFRLVENSYLAHMEQALKQEWDERKKQSDGANIFDQAAFLVNVRQNLRTDIPVSSIREIMFHSYLPTIRDHFLLYLGGSEQAMNRKERIAYGKPAEQFFTGILRKDPGSLNRYLKTRWDDLNSMANSNPAVAEILGTQTPQTQALSAPEKRGIMPEEYRELPKMKRILLARAAVMIFPLALMDSIFGEEFANQELLPMIRSDLKTNATLLSFLRSRPRYLEAVNRRDYDSALPLLHADAHSLPGGVPTEADRRIKTTLELEKTRMNEYFPPEEWEKAVQKKTETKLSRKLSSRDFLDLLRAQFKNRTDIPEEKQNALLALSELNRGRRGAGLDLFLQTTKENLIQNNIPPEELNND